jgi:hypothetical protein
VEGDYSLEVQDVLVHRATQSVVNLVAVVLVVSIERALDVCAGEEKSARNDEREAEDEQPEAATSTKTEPSRLKW